MQQLLSNWWIALMFAVTIFTLISIIHMIDRPRFGKKMLHSIIIIGMFGSGASSERRSGVPP